MHFSRCLSLFLILGITPGVLAQTSAQTPTAVNDDFIQKQFGLTCSSIAGPPTYTADLDRDGIEDAVIVAVMRDGQVFLDTQKVTPEELTQKVKDRVSSRTNKQVFVKADARAKYKGVVEVVDDVRSAGVDQVGLLTEQRRDPNKPPQ